MPIDVLGFGRILGTIFDSFFAYRIASGVSRPNKNLSNDPGKKKKMETTIRYRLPSSIPQLMMMMEVETRKKRSRHDADVVPGKLSFSSHAMRRRRRRYGERTQQNQLSFHQTMEVEEQGDSRQAKEAL